MTLTGTVCWAALTKLVEEDLDTVVAVEETVTVAVTDVRINRAVRMSVVVHLQFADVCAGRSSQSAVPVLRYSLLVKVGNASMTFCKNLHSLCAFGG
jgi:hypothetical protein